MAVTRSGRPSELVDRCLPTSEIAAVVEGSDHLVVAVPGYQETYGLVSRDIIARLPAHATLVNVARSSVVDTDAVVDALRAKRLRAALLDVPCTGAPATRIRRFGG